MIAIYIIAPNTNLAQFERKYIYATIKDIVYVIVYCLAFVIGYSWPVLLFSNKRLFALTLAVNTILNLLIPELKWLILAVLIVAFLVCLYLWSYMIYKFLWWLKKEILKLKMHRNNILKKTHSLSNNSSQSK